MVYLQSDKGVQWMTLLMSKRQQAAIAAQQLLQKQQENVEDTPAVGQQILTMLSKPTMLCIRRRACERKGGYDR